MTEDVQVASDNSVGENTVSQNESVQNVAENSSSDDNSTAQAPIEKMVPQSVVDKIVGGTKKEAYEKALQRARQEVIAEQQQHNQASSNSGSGGVDINQITQQIYQRFQQDQIAMQGNKIAQEYQNKIQQEFYNDPDFMDRYKDSQIENHPQIVLLANELPNTAAVIKDMVDNPLKFTNFLTLAMSNPIMAKKELAKLSKSLKDIDIAKTQPKSTQPLGQVKSSTNGIGGAGNGGELSVSELRKKYF